MATQYTSLLGLALPVTGELSGSWGDVVNDSITSLLDSAISGTTSLTTDADATLTTTTGAANQARQAIILWNPASGTVTRNITAPAQSKIYTVINASGGTQSIVFRGAGPTTGVTIVKGESAVVAWNGTDFIKISNAGGSASFTNVTVSGTTTLSGLTASTALALDASKNVVSVTNTGTGNNVLSASPTLTGTISGANASLSGTLGVTGVATFTAQPILSSLTASQAVFTDGSKGLVSNAITGTGNVVMSASPTLTGTITAAAANFSGAVALGDAAADNITVNGTVTSNLLFTDNTYDIGALGATRPRDLFLSRNLTVGGTLTLAGGVNLNGNVTVGDSSADTLTINSTVTSNLLFTDNTYDIGASGATRPRNLFLAGNATVGGNIVLTGSLDLTNLEVTNIKAKDGTAGMQIADSTGVVSFTANPVLSGGTANGVAYLNGSKVLTTGSALTFDGTNLGLGVTPTSLTNGPHLDIGSTRGTVSIGTGYIEDNGTTQLFNGTRPIAFSIGGTEGMRLTSTGLGIGTSSPTNKLSVSGNANVTGNTTLGDASTNTVTVNGYMGVGGAAGSTSGIIVQGSALTSTSQTGITAVINGNSSATSRIRGFASGIGTTASAFTVTDLANFWASNASKGAGSTITNQHGIYIADQTEGTNNYGITSLVSSGTNKWNIYASGTAANYFAGNVQFAAGSAAAPALTRFGDDNTGIFFPAADTIAFANGGSERARINSSGAWSYGSSGTATGAIGEVLTSQGPSAPPVWAASGGGSTDIQEFTSVGTSTWTKPIGAKMVYVLLFGGGGGGGSGRRRATASIATAAAGGAGGGASGRLEYWLPASLLGSTETVTVGAGSTGGASSTVDDTSGTSASAGGNSSFGAFALVRGGAGGGGGTTVAVSASQSGNSLSESLIGSSVVTGNGGAGQLGAAGNPGAAGGFRAGGGGGSSGFAASSTTASSGGAGGLGGIFLTTSLSNNGGGGAGGTSGAAGGSGDNGSNSTNYFAGGSGGGGGACGTSSAGSGGNGGYPGGGGGGGGAGHGVNSGAGGNGGNGYVRIITFF